MLELNLQATLQYLKGKKREAFLQKETNQLCLILKIDEREFPLFIRVSDESDILQMVTFIPKNTTKETVSDVARLLHLFNKELDLPGFGLNEESGHIFYRCFIPSTKRKYDPAYLDAYINATEIVCKSFSPAIESVAGGLISFEDLLSKAQENQNQSN